MQPFEYARAGDAGSAVAMVGADPRAAFLAGGTTQVDLMLKDGVVEVDRLVDITRLPLRGITCGEEALTVGALTTMEELAADRTVIERLPLVREALLASASTQLRNMATIGGNVLQRTRCRYFRDPTVAACNKRAPGSGCAAVHGAARMHAILGASERCIALHASDLCVALVALDASVQILGADGERSVPLREFYILPGDRPDVENVLAHGELITEIVVPLLPRGARSGYLKIRDRSSYEFALASVAAALVIEDGVMVQARFAVGGVGTVPWRAPAAERLLVGSRPDDPVFAAAARLAIADPFTVAGTAFKVPLAERTIVRMLQDLTEAGS
jgi:xanthine dehydrogenase YagS FAD-binding subunit